MRTQHWGLVTLLFFVPFTFAENANDPPASSAADHSGRLPVKRVVLYKNGVGYFEHSARVRANEDLAIDFTTAQLNDVLKSLTVVDLGDGHISSVRYNSIAPLDERLKALRLPFGEAITRSDFLSALRGARVEVRSKGETTSGRLLSVEQEDRTNDSGVTSHLTEFSIVTDTGEMRNFELEPAISVRLAERDLNDEVERYLNLVGSSRARDLRRMTISATGSGDREIFVSYVSEVPVWKSTYRVVLPDKPGEKPLLQGWAIIDNTIGEDWKDVQLSLVAGAPQSFIQDISQPLYARRPVVPLPQSAMLTPQTQEATMKEEETPTAAGSGSGSGSGRGLGRSRNGVIGGVPGGIQGGQMGGVMGSTVARSPLATPATVNHAAGLTVETDRLEQYAKLAPSAESKDLGDYFEYNIKQAITIGKNQSALVPILQSRIDAEKVTLWAADGNQPPLRALWIKNASGITLDSGTFNIVDKGTFAGEGLVATVHPDERRLLSYAADTAVHVTSQSDFKNKPVSHVRIAKGVLWVTREQRSKVTYLIRNSDTALRPVVIEHPVREGWKLIEDDKPEETSLTHYRFRVTVEPSKTRELTVEEFHPELTRSMLTDLTREQVEVFSVENRMTPAIQEAFRRVLEQKNRLSDLAWQIETRRQGLNAINKDQARIRENMKALKGSTEEKALLQRYTRQLDSQEDRLNTLNKEISEIEEKKNQEQQKLEAMVQQITLDESF